LPGSSSIQAGDDFRPLFNGKDLSGWVPVNVAPETFTVRDGMIVSTGKPTGVIRTDRQYENFVIELEWRHLEPGGNAGLFVCSDASPAVGVPFTRSFEVQILDGRDGPNTMKKDRVTVILNGQTVIDSLQLPGIPARGPLGLQHHGDPVQFTNLFIRELE
jgi:hypothetical protein